MWQLHACTATQLRGNVGYRLSEIILECGEFVVAWVQVGEEHLRADKGQRSTVARDLWDVADSPWGTSQWPTAADGETATERPQRICTTHCAAGPRESVAARSYSLWFVVKYRFKFLSFCAINQTTGVCNIAYSSVCPTSVQFGWGCGRRASGIKLGYVGADGLETQMTWQPSWVSSMGASVSHPCSSQIRQKMAGLKKKVGYCTWML